MKHSLLLGATTLLLVGLGIGAGQAGLLDQVIQQTTQPAPAPQTPQGGGSVIDDVGGLLGVNPQKLDLLKKGLQTAQAMQPIKEDAERALGETIGIEAFSRYGGVYRNENLTRYVTLVGRTIAEVTERPLLNYHFAILDNPDENAFAAPGGFVFVTRGLLQALNNEAELAGVLGHELAHINLKHMLNTVQRGSILASVSDLSLSALHKDPKLLGAAIDQINDLLFTHGLDKELEFEADRYGLEYAQRAGYAPAGVKNYLQRLARKQNSSRSVFFTTHPPLAERLQRVERQLAGMVRDNRLALLEERFKRNMRAM